MHIKTYSEFPVNLIDTNSIPVFAGPDYARYLNEVKSQIVSWFIGYENEIAVCMIPFSIRKKFLFKKGYFLTAVNNLYEINEFEERVFLEKVIEYIKQKKLCDWIEQPPNWAIFRTVPLNSIYCKFGSYIIDLRDKCKTELYENLHKKQRQSLNRGLRDGIIIKKGNNCLEDCMLVLKDINKREGVKYPSKEEIKKLISILKDKVQIYISVYKNKPQAAGILFTNSYGTYSVYGGTISNAAQGSDPLLGWESIIDSSENKVQYFDFVGARINPSPGSKYERIQKFKERFGSQMVTGYLWKMPLSRVKYTLYLFYINLTCLLKFKIYKGDIIDQELTIAEKKSSPLKLILQALTGKRTRVINLALCTYDSLINSLELVILN